MADPEIDSTSVTPTGTTCDTSVTVLTDTTIIKFGRTTIINTGKFEDKKEEIYFDEDDAYWIREGINACELKHIISERNKRTRSKRSVKEMNRGYRGLNKIYFGRKGRNN